MQRCAALAENHSGFGSTNNGWMDGWLAPLKVIIWARMELITIATKVIEGNKVPNSDTEYL